VSFPHLPLEVVCGQISKQTRIESRPQGEQDMNAWKVSRISIVIFGLGVACLTARPCRAQAEINPDHYDEAPSSSSIVRPATATQPIAANRNGAAVSASTCAQAQAAADSKQTGCNAAQAHQVRASRAVVPARAITSPAKEKDKSIRQVASVRNSG
jgi:hypothetical protein